TLANLPRAPPPATATAPPPAIRHPLPTHRLRLHVQRQMPLHRRRAARREELPSRAQLLREDLLIVVIGLFVLGLFFLVVELVLQFVEHLEQERQRADAQVGHL